MSALETLLEMDDTITHIVFGSHTRLWLYDEDEPEHIKYTAIPAETVLAFDEAAGMLRDWEINSGYGAEEVFPIHAWSDNWVYFICCYDGATWLSKVPRHPCNDEPKVHGRG